MALTRRQRQVLDVIHGFIEENGYSPSLEEIGARGRQLGSYLACLGAANGSHERIATETAAVDISFAPIEEGAFSAVLTASSDDPSGDAPPTMYSLL